MLDESVPVFPGRYFHQTLVTTAHHGNGGGLGGELAGTTGVERLRVETVPQIVTRGWLVDVAPLQPGDVIGVDALDGIDASPDRARRGHDGREQRGAADPCPVVAWAACAAVLAACADVLGGAFAVAPATRRAWVGARIVPNQVR